MGNVDFVWNGRRVEGNVRRPALLCNKIPALAHASGQCLFVHRLGFNPSPSGRANVIRDETIDIVAGNPEVMDVHGQPDVCEDVDQ